MCIFILIKQKNRGPGPHNSLHHTDNRKYFSSPFLTRNRREAHIFHLAREVEKLGDLLAEKGNFILIYELI